MILLSHRGLWREPSEKNTPQALARSAADGFGAELDVRDCARALVISHDPPVGDEPSLAEGVAPFAGRGLTLAINVKADGLAASLADFFASFDAPWFAFDMSGPEMVRYLALRLPVFTRHSDVEPEPLLYDACEGVWLDAFRDDWYDHEVISNHLARGRRVCIVSPELHGRDPQRVWSEIGRRFSGETGVMLCTDWPARAAKAVGLT